MNGTEGEFGEPTASMLVIGDEILSGRTKDVNVGHLADVMTAIGVDLVEVRMVPDDHAAIADAVNALRARTDYVFTTGGIGPTHDDITAEAVSQAFGVSCVHDPRAMDILSKAYRERELAFTDSRARMARMPEGCELIANRVSRAPGFRKENVYVMAGVPKIMQAMLDEIVPTLRTGRKMVTRSVVCGLGEGIVGQPLGEIQRAHPDTMIGSYPRWDGRHFSTELVVRGRDEEAVSAAFSAVEVMVRELGG